mmetsp:Transcript_22814/g.63734  ORF Transcript_22814/g.63734 Transcript_22814/m.63734 type:complete len:216 (-) Transcript_22814:1105-1752(-)
MARTDSFGARGRSSSRTSSLFAPARFKDDNFDSRTRSAPLNTSPTVGSGPLNRTTFPAPAKKTQSGRRNSKMSVWMLETTTGGNRQQAARFRRTNVARLTHCRRADRRSIIEVNSSRQTGDEWESRRTCSAKCRAASAAACSPDESVQYGRDQQPMGTASAVKNSSAWAVAFPGICASTGSSLDQGNGACELSWSRRARADVLPDPEGPTIAARP